MLHITSLLRKAILYNLAYRPDIAILKTINTPSWAVYERLINEMEIKIKASIAISQIQNDTVLPKRFSTAVYI